MRLFKSKEEKEEIKDFQKKCNFLSNSGRCDITINDERCSFNDCIFIKILDKLSGGNKK